MKRKTLLAQLGVICFVSILVAFMAACAQPSPPTPTPTPATPAEPAKPIELKYHTFLPAPNDRVKTDEAWFRQIEKSSGGKVKFTSYYTSSLFGRTEEWDHVRKGTADIAVISAANQPAYFPLTLFAAECWYGSDPKTIYKLMPEADKALPELAKEWAAVKTLSYWSVSANQLHTKTPVRHLADMKGLSIQLQGLRGLEVLKKYGAIPNSTAASDLYSAIDKGVVKGSLCVIGLLKVYSLAEVCPYTTMLDLVGGSTLRTVMNMDSWNKLPSDIQKIIDDTMPQYRQDYFDAGVTKEIKDAMEYANKLGHEWIELPPGELAEAQKIVGEQQLPNAVELDKKGLPGTKTHDVIRQIIEKNK